MGMTTQVAKRMHIIYINNTYRLQFFNPNALQCIYIITVMRKKMMYVPAIPIPKPRLPNTAAAVASE